MSSTGLTVCLEVLSALEPCSENTITSPSVSAGHAGAQ